MNNYKLRFADIIPDLSAQMGIGHLDDMGRAIEGAKEQGYSELADWFQTVKDRLSLAVEEEWSAIPYDDASPDYPF